MPQAHTNVDIGAADHDHQLASILLNAGGLGLVQFDTDSLRLRSVNPAFAGLVGHDESDLLGKSLPEILHADDRAAHVRALKAALSNDGTFGTETRLVHAEGHVVWALLTAHAMPVKSNVASRSFALIQDISERKRAEQAGRTSESRLRNVLSHAGAGVVEADSAGRMTFVNHAWCEMLGYSEAELVGLSITDITDPASLPSTLAAVRKMAAGGPAFVIEKNYRRKDGSLLAASSSVTPLRAADGTYEGFIAVVADVTSHRRARLAQIDNRRLLALALNGARAGAWEVDLATGERRWAQGMAELLDIEPHQMASEQARWLAYVHPDDRARLVESLGRLVQGQERIWAAQFRAIRAKGEVRWMAARGAVFTLPDGSRKLVGVDVDVTETKRAEESLREADRQKDEFIATLAHELRNPLAPISAAVQLLGVSRSEVDREKLRSMMERQMRHIVHLIDDLLDVSRIAHGKVQLHTERIDLRTAVDVALDALRATDAAGAHELRVDLGSEPAWVEADFTRMTQIAGNILNNAAKYTPAGGWIAVTIERSGNGAVLKVADNGRGIPAQMQEDVFTMFSRVDKALNQEQEGLGIGLALARALVEMHGGSLGVHSDGVGEGSTFTMRLPIAAAPVIVALDGAAVRTRGKSEVRVLVADDNRDAADTLSQLLTLWGYTVMTAYQGEDALKVASTFHPDVAILDLGMPDIDGFQVAHSIRAEKAHCRLIALTGWGTADDRERSRNAGFDLHLTKPVEAVALADALGKVTAEAC